MDWIGYTESAQTNKEHEVTVAQPEAKLTDDSIQESTDGTFIGNVNAINAQDNDKAQEVKRDITQDELKMSHLYYKHH